MKKKDTLKKNITKKQEKRINDALENLKNIHEKLAPYIKPTRMEELKPGGNWKGSSTENIYIQDGFQKTLKDVTRPALHQSIQGR